MSTSQFVCVIVVLAFVVVSSSHVGWATALASGYIITLGGITTTLYVLPGVPDHIGIARSTPTLYLGDLLLVAATIAILAGGGSIKVGWHLTSFLIPALFLLVLFWGNTTEQWSGLKLYATALISFGIGRWLSETIEAKSARLLAVSCFIVTAAQTLIALAQSQGIYLIGQASVDATRWINEERMVGLYGHPGTLGRTMFLLLCFLLPLTVSGEKLTRRIAFAAVFLGITATLLTLSRANAAAIGIAIVVWLLLSGHATSFGRRVGIAVIGGLVIALNSNQIEGLELRQAEDPRYGFRDQIFDVGIAQIQSAPMSGIGPNYYTEVVGDYDRLSAAGYPLHNSFLFPVAELGLPLAIAFFMPLILVAMRTLRRVFVEQKMDAQAVTFLSLAPGLVVIAWSGWGLVQSDSLPLWFMAFGFLATRTSYFDFTKKADVSLGQKESHSPIRAQ